VEAFEACLALGETEVVALDHEAASTRQGMGLEASHLQKFHADFNPGAATRDWVFFWKAP
jgi:hypothetical protein